MLCNLGLIDEAIYDATQATKVSALAFLYEEYHCH